jgi:hypothetical protein
MTTKAFLSALLLIIIFGSALAFAQNSDSPSAEMAPRSECTALLSQAVIDRIRDETRRDIQNRAKQVGNSTKPLLVDKDGKPRVDLLEGMTREFPAPVFEASKNVIITRFNVLAQKWTNAAKLAIQTRYKTTKPRIEWDADGIPLTPFFQSHRKLALSIKAERQDKLNASEFEQQMAQAIIDEMRKAAVTAFRGASDKVMKEAEDLLADTEKEKGPDWKAVLYASEPILAKFLNDLETHFPIQELADKNVKAAVDAVEVARSPIENAVVVASVTDGVPSLSMPALKARAYYEKGLGTMVLEPIGGVVADEYAPIFLLDHGDGTVKSTAASWKSLFPKFMSSKLNPMAMNNPRSGAISMQQKGIFRTAAWLHWRSVWTKDHYAIGEDVVRPLTNEGRSMGGQRSILHYLFQELGFFGPEVDPITNYETMSCSNPFTIEPQVINVYNQVAAGTIKVVRSSLENARMASAQLRGFLYRVKKKRPNDLAVFGDRMMMKQGDGDEDAWPTGWEDGVALQQEYLPTAHAYKFENRLLKYKIPNFEFVDPENWEGTHTIYSNSPNLTRDKIVAGIVSLHHQIKNEPDLKKQEVLVKIRDVFQAIVDRVPDVDLPALQDQYFEGMALHWGFYDYLRTSRSKVPSTIEAKNTIEAFRLKFTKGEDISYLQAFQRSAKISDADLEAAKPGRESRAARLKRVMEYWKSERVRVDAILKAHGLLAETP